MDIEDVGEPLGLLTIKPQCPLSASTPEGSTCQHRAKVFSLTDMPEEILEHILGFLSPYCDMDSARLVSKQWLRVIKSVVSQSKRRFYQKLTSGEVCWTIPSKASNVTTGRYVSCISDRHSHSAVYYDGSMYVFGGCTSTNTTFNDLWRFNLTSREWIRPVAIGTYPSPKACATMVVYQGTLVLFGGWSHPIPYPNPHQSFPSLLQSAHYFSELHIYTPATNRWSHILSIGQEPEALGGHSASIAGHLMVIFGGSPRTGLGTNNVWVFNLEKLSWKLQAVGDVKPEPRYGQYQTTIDDSHILILGGSVGQNRVYNDVWLLTLHPCDPWTWTKITVEHPELAAPQSWCHASCRVNNVIVVVAKSSRQRQARNVRPQVAQRPDREGMGACPYATLAVPQEVQQHRPGCCEAQAHHHLQQQQYECANDSLCMENAAGSDEDREHNLPNRNLLELQQRLHRECANLSDASDHHHVAAADRDDPEGGFHRLNNRWGGNDRQAPASHQHNNHHHHHSHQQSDQPQYGSFQHRGGNLRCRGIGHMPSIRPNAMCNRQKQLEALQRQEELLRSKSRALAAARNKLPDPDAAGGGGSRAAEVDETVPDIVVTKNKMDVHILDLSQLMSKQTVQWKPLTTLQPAGAPTETICCSLLEGRCELMLFGGVIRDMKSPTTNTAINKLYSLQPC